MSDQPLLEPTVSDVEALMLEHFRQVPFHNLPLLYGEDLRQLLPGGTCSDMTLRFLRVARRAGIDARLHSGFIRGKEIHRLARIKLDGRSYFADVGNGWPALRLYPADGEVEHHAFGMRFRTQIQDSRVHVFHQRRGQEYLQLEIAVEPRPEEEIYADITRRFSSGVDYPFSRSLRFSRIVGQRFMFLRGDQLEIYSPHGVEVLEGIDAHQVPSVLRDQFQVDFDTELLRRSPGFVNTLIAHRAGSERPRPGGEAADCEETP